ncbi:MAG: carboxypeptidase regulatory-like domain-containing protein, partial [Planctomycetaceae bacterium]
FPWFGVSRSIPAERYDFLTWQQRRLEAAVHDALATERSHLIGAATAYHRAAATIALQPPLPDPLQPRLQIAAPQRIDLIGAAQQEVILTVTNRQVQPLDAWIFCDYDPQLIEVSPALDDVLYDQSILVSLTQATFGERFTDLSELAGREPSFRLRASETGSLRLRIRRKTPTGRAARIVFRAVCEAQVVRHDCTVDLPRSPDLDLYVEGMRDTQQWTENQWKLYPFPNRTTSYQLYLVNPGTSARTVDFQLLPAPRASALAAPPGEVAADVADDYLALVKASDAVLQHQGIVVPAGGARVPITLLPSAPENGAEPGGEAEAPTPLPPVLLAVATDTATGRKTIRRLEILVQRPGRYIEPRVQYDPQSGRVEILVRPLAAVPPAGISITVLPPPSADGEIRGRATALLQPGATETRLHIQVPPDAGPVFPVTIDVDDFKRAFRYEVPTTAVVRTVVPPSNRVRVRIVEPEAGKCFGPEPKAIEVSLQVDMPYAVLSDGSSSLEVGIDVDRDRTLVGEPSLRVTSDRLVELQLDPDIADGTLAISTRTSDLVVTLPPPPVRAGRANLLARAILPDQDVWSEPVEIVFDDEAPQISRVQLMPGRSVAQGELLQVSLLASDGELSGVARVEAAFDLERRGEFTPETKPIPGALQSDGRWRIDLPTAPVNPGVYDVLIRATDRVGNPSEYQRTGVEVLAKDAAKPAMENRISGRVVFGRLAKTPTAGITVRLIEGDKPIRERQSDKDGQFVFDKVPPGDYRLEAAGLIAGNRRTGTMQLEVPPAPEAIPPIELILQTEP